MEFESINKGYQKLDKPLNEEQKAKMLKDLNEKLFKNLVNKEKTNLHRNLHAWREGTEKNVAEKNARAKWVEFGD